MENLIEVTSTRDIPASYRNTPISLLVEYQNLGRTHENYSKAQLLVGMCMDHRKHLNIPENFSYIIRTGGANLRYSEFKVSYAIAVGGVKHIALIGHNNCGMVHLAERKNLFIEGMVLNAGWSMEKAEEHFNLFAPMFEIGNAADFVASEAIRLRQRYPGVTVAPMFYDVNTNRICFVKE